MKNLVNRLIRFIWQFKRPSKRTNIRLLHERGENISTFIIRDAEPEDIPALAALHVKTWSDTYWNVTHPPTYATREYQWQEQFKQADGNWFCIIIENQQGKLVGFSKGISYSSADLPGYSGELSKIYLLREYQRLGLGRRMMGHVARRFLSKGITTMVLFGEPQNPSGNFHEALEGKKLFAKNGDFHGGYGWKDLTRLAQICPVD